MRYDSPKTFFYLDPPYVLSARTGKEYNHEMSDDAHRELVEAVQHLRGKVMLSGYENEIYAPLTKAWNRKEFIINCKVDKDKTSKVKEIVWCNYEKEGLLPYEGLPSQQKTRRDERKVAN